MNAKQVNPKRSADTPSAGDADAVPHELSLALARNLVAARTEIGMSQRTLAAQSGLARTYLRRVEAGEANIGLGVLMILARVLGKEAAGLIMLAPEMPRREAIETPPEASPKKT